MFQLFVVFSLSVFTHGFLLEPQKQTTGEQYLTVSEFYNQVKQQHENLEHVRSETVQLHSETEQLRQYTDKSLQTLASQIQQELNSMKNEIKENGNRNVTFVSHEDLEQRYKMLEDNNTVLQVKFDELLKKYEIQEQEKKTMQSKVRLLESNLEQAQLSLNKTIVQTTKTDQQISELMTLKTVQTSFDIQYITQQVKTLNTEVLTLSVSEQARNQDFMALYNITMASKFDINSIKTNQNLLGMKLKTIAHRFENDILNSSLEIFREISAVRDDFNETIEDHEKSSNRTLALLEQRIDTMNEKVALTSCISSTKIYSNGEVIIFDDIKTKTGITDVHPFKSTGKFTCHTPGLYQVSVTIVTHSSTQYAVYKNGHQFGTTYISSNGGNESGSLIVAMELVVNDKVWITAISNSFYVFASYSCVTFVKIK